MNSQCRSTCQNPAGESHCIPVSLRPGMGDTSAGPVVRPVSPAWILLVIPTVHWSPCSVWGQWGPCRPSMQSLQRGTEKESGHLWEWWRELCPNRDDRWSIEAFGNCSSEALHLLLMLHFLSLLPMSSKSSWKMLFLSLHCTSLLPSALAGGWVDDDDWLLPI